MFLLVNALGLLEITYRRDLGQNLVNGGGRLLPVICSRRSIARSRSLLSELLGLLRPGSLGLFMPGGLLSITSHCRLAARQSLDVSVDEPGGRIFPKIAFAFEAAPREGGGTLVRSVGRVSG